MRTLHSISVVFRAQRGRVSLQRRSGPHLCYPPSYHTRWTGSPSRVLEAPQQTRWQTAGSWGNIPQRQHMVLIGHSQVSGHDLALRKDVCAPQPDPAAPNHVLAQIHFTCSAKPTRASTFLE